MFELLIKDHISSAHLLRGYEGKCKNLHGHTWKIELHLIGEQLNELGMVVDFSEVKNKLKEFLKSIDHVHLNDLEYFKTVNPTAENIAKYIYDEFSSVINPVKVKKVTVWESDQCCASYYEK